MKLTHAGRERATRKPATALRGAALVLLFCTPLIAFAGRKEADQAMTEARSAISAAERAGAPQSATIELKIARDGFASADTRYEDRDWDEAERWAQRARYDAWLAEARSRQRRAEALTAEIEAVIRTLQTEIGG